jgi:CrcB protein
MMALYVFIGGGLGSLCRYGIALLFVESNLKLPAATLTANILAGLVLGMIIGWASRHTQNLPILLFGATGFCGGFSTFSTFSLENVQLWQEGHYLSMITNIILSVVLCFAGVLIGMKLISAS